MDDIIQHNGAFLVGKNVYLRPPDLHRDIVEGNWHTWFNDQKITKYLLHGKFPITREQQENYIRKELDNPGSLLLSIISSKTDEHIGIISLKSIDLINGVAEIGMVTNMQVPGAPLEAMALLTSHGFEKLNLIKIWGGQHEDLWKWCNSLELIGYKFEGYKRSERREEGQSYDVVTMGITAQDYFRIKKERGQLWHKDLYNRRRKENLLPKIKKLLSQLYD